MSMILTHSSSPGRDDLVGLIDVVDSHFRDVDQALDPVADLDESAERHQLRNPAINELAHPVGVGELLPRVRLGRLQGQADAFAVEVDVQDPHRHMVTHLDDLARVVDVLPRQFGHVDQPVHPAEVDESAEVDDGRNDALAHLARLQVGQELVALRSAALLRGKPAARAPRCCGFCPAR